MCTAFAAVRTLSSLLKHHKEERDLSVWKGLVARCSRCCATGEQDGVAAKSKERAAKERHQSSDPLTQPPVMNLLLAGISMLW